MLYMGLSHSVILTKNVFSFLQIDMNDPKQQINTLKSQSSLYFKENQDIV